MNFIVVGCGRVGAELCYHLFTRGHHVVAVDINKEAFNRLHPDFRGRTLEGEGLAEGVLERAGIRDADGLAAVTNSDTLNAIVAHAARTIYNVPNVVARNYDPNLRTVIEAFRRFHILGRPARGGIADEPFAADGVFCWQWRSGSL